MWWPFRISNGLPKGHLSPGYLTPPSTLMPVCVMCVRKSAWCAKQRGRGRNSYLKRTNYLSWALSHCWQAGRGWGWGAALYVESWAYLLISIQMEPGGSVLKNLPAKAEDAGDAGSISGVGRSPGGGNDNPLQCSCLENPMDRGAW